MIPPRYKEIASNGNITLGLFDLSELDVVIKYRSRRRRDGLVRYNVNNDRYLVQANSKRYPVFVENKVCEICNINGSYLLLETNPESIKKKRAHFNLYGVEDNKLLLMTVDHILPQSLGGNDGIKNLRTLCCLCNNARGNEFEDDATVLVKRNRIKEKIMKRCCV